MIKKQKETEKVSALEKSPYMYYVTNWGFVEQPLKSEIKQKSKR
ncbi:hypothetical protein ACL9RF_11585 [Sphingobacterium sp. Mn56C]